MAVNNQVQWPMERRSARKFSPGHFWAIAPVCVLVDPVFVHESEHLGFPGETHRTGFVADRGLIEMGSRGALRTDFARHSLSWDWLSGFGAINRLPASNRVPGPRYPFFYWLFLLAVFAARD